MSENKRDLSSNEGSEDEASKRLKPDNETDHSEVESEAESFISDDDNYDDGGDVELDVIALQRQSECNYSHSEGSSSLTEPEAREEMTKTVAAVMQTLQVPAPIAFILLVHFKWDTGMLFEKYWCDDAAEYFEKNGIIIVDEMEASKEDEEIECPVCYEGFPSSSVSPPPCGHVTCSRCLQHYLRGKINEASTNCTICCPQHGCKAVLSYEYILYGLKDDPGMRGRYDQLLIRAFVAQCSFLQYCPKQGCEQIWKADSGSSNWQQVDCPCGDVFCFGCATSWHFPMKCSLIKVWSKACSADSFVSNWILKNTKPCPNCNADIEKNGGCNHMTCKKCKEEFCWICGASWRNHSYNCNKPNPTLQQNEKRVNLKRFEFCHDRYSIHKQSFELEKKNLVGESLLEKLEWIRKGSNLTSTVDCLFYKDAVKTLQECRRLLQYSFPFVFYLTKDNLNFSDIFEDNLCQLHQSVETLSGVLEAQESPQIIYIERANIANLAAFCKQRCITLIAHVNEGYSKNIWKFTVPI